MKQIILSVSMALISLAGFANREVSPQALASFNTSFKSATEVIWTVTDDYFKAGFIQNGQHIAAYYDSDGNLIALTRHISSLQLPVFLQASLKQQYENYWISELFEMAKDNITTYYITVENGDTRIVLQSTAGSGWFIYSRQRKS